MYPAGKASVSLVFSPVINETRAAFTCMKDGICHQEAKGSQCFLLWLD